MSDDKGNRGPQDRSRITMHEGYEVEYWTKELDLTREDLQKLVDRVGTSADAVRDELSRTHR